jgi:GMP synthase (glutamine-hydrolysing)
VNGRLLVIQHEDNAPPAWFGEWISGVGIELCMLLGHRGDRVPADLSGYDGLLVLGGAMGANDDDAYDWLAPTKRLIADTVQRASKPFLGICLGHQLAAVACGGRVQPNPLGRALGLTPVGLTDAGRADPLLGGLVAPGAQSVQWNDDVVTRMPPGSTVLAFAPDGTVQAARLGDRAWGVQFHPEVSPEVFARWGAEARATDPSASGTAAAAAAADEIATRGPELAATWRPLAERFAAMLDGAQVATPQATR